MRGSSKYLVMPRALLAALLVLHAASADTSAKHVLLDFAASMRKCNPHALRTWTNTTALGEFDGVTVSSAGLVTDLDLDGEGLCGVLPRAWSALHAREWQVLKKLQNLVISSNPRLTGSLPPAWSKLVALTALDLNSNPRMTGPLPPAWRTLVELQYLDLSDIPGLAGPLPPEWSELKMLQTLRLPRNPRLAGPLPPEWSTLAALTELDLQSNSGIAGPLPAAWSALSPALAYLDLSSNLGLSGTLPPAWSKLTALTALHLQSNPGLAGSLPPAWALLTGLQDLNLSSNPRLVGPLPPAWSSLTALTALYLQSNPSLTGPLPPAWSKLTGLVEMHLQSNPGLTGSLPPQWSQLTNLEELRLRSNTGLTGPLPGAWSNLLWLRTLRTAGSGMGVAQQYGMHACTGDLSKIHALRGVLPQWMGSLQALRRLRMADCSLDGTLPASISNLVKLRILDLSRNSLYGTLPAFWGALADLSSLDLSYNNCSGTLPASWTALKSLSVIKLAGNKLNGSLVGWAKKASWWHASRFVDLSNNRLSGRLPEFPATVQLFNGSANNLSGAIPAIPPLLVYLHVGRNNLSGPMPDVLNSTLVFLDASQNHLSMLPLKFQAPGATYINLAGNQLHGTLPDGYSHKFAYCDLSHNRLFGSIPASWHGKAWQYLALDGNLLSGTLSSWTGNVTVLLLQRNHLNGSLPEHWPGNSTSRVLSFASNDVSGLPNRWGMSFNKLSLLDVSNNAKVKSVPVEWMDQHAFHGNQTVLRLGLLWKLSAKHRKWRKKVCIQQDLYSRLSLSLQTSTIPEDVHTQLQAELNNALAGLNVTLQELNVTGVTFDVGDLPLRQGDVGNVTVQQICDNQDAVVIVAVLWAFVCFMILCLFILYSLEVRWRALSGIILRVGQHFSLQLDTQRRGAHAVTFRRPILRSAKYVLSLVLYWFDVITDIIWIAHVWPLGKWPRYVLLGVLILHYAGMVVLVFWQLGHLPVLHRVTWLVIGVPLMPVLDTAVCAYLGMSSHMQQQIQSWRVFEQLQCVHWKALFDMRETLEVLLEAVPTAVLQSVIFLLGNNPKVGWFLESHLYILTFVGSCAQILRLVVIVLWRSLQTGTSPCMTLWFRVRSVVLVGGVSGGKGGSADAGQPGEGGRTGASSANTTRQVPRTHDTETAVAGMREL